MTTASQDGLATIATARWSSASSASSPRRPSPPPAGTSHAPSRPIRAPAGAAGHQRRSSAQHQVLLVTGVRAIVLAASLHWLLDPATAGPLGPVVATWTATSVLAVAVLAAGRDPWAGVQVMVAAVDVAVVVAVTLSAPGGYLPVALLAVVVLVQVPLRWGPLPASVVLVLLCAVGASNPAPPPVDLEGAVVVGVDAAVVVLCLVARGVRARRAGPARAGAAASVMAFEHCPAGMALIDATGTVRSANPTLARWCRTTPQALAGRSLGEVVHPGDLGALAEALAAGPAGGGYVEVRLLAAGQERWVRLRTADVPSATGGPDLGVVVVEDAVEHRATTQRLAHDAAHDALTGLPNRRAVTGELAALVAAPERASALLMIDLDGFKAVNDRLGHDAGDELLRVVADRLRSCLRPGDVAGRLGGDEMLVLAHDVAHDAGARAVGRRVLDALVWPASLRAGAVGLRASIGVRRIDAGDHDALALTRDADAALYRAKREGGCCVRLARPGESDLELAVAAPTTATRLGR